MLRTCLKPTGIFIIIKTRHSFVRTFGNTVHADGQCFNNYKNTGYKESLTVSVLIIIKIPVTKNDSPFIPRTAFSWINLCHILKAGADTLYKYASDCRWTPAETALQPYVPNYATNKERKVKYDAKKCHERSIYLSCLSI